jgi:poly-gamma-glutamate synthesis protein (capsule biosynthesis protein)
MLCGDVMVGRGIDQVLPYPADPVLYEDYARSALDYVTLAERRSGPIGRRLPVAAVWGDALDELRRRQMDCRVGNLETAITRRGEPERKGINYRMAPENAPVLTAMQFDCLSLANNHVLDWGKDGLADTLDTLKAAGIGAAGAGPDLGAAEAPAIVTLSDRRVLFYAAALSSAGVPMSWAAAKDRPGVNLLPATSESEVKRIAARIAADRTADDVVVFSLHWGGNWGYAIPRPNQAFARALIAEAGVDIVHGHSTHHPIAIEVFEQKPIFYGCGDFISDYEGISGHEAYRPDLALAYVVTLDERRCLSQIETATFRVRQFGLRRAGPEDVEWIRATMDRECRRFGARASLERGRLLVLPDHESRHRRRRR